MSASSCWRAACQSSFQTGGKQSRLHPGVLRCFEAADCRIFFFYPIYYGCTPSGAPSLAPRPFRVSCPPRYPTRCAQALADGKNRQILRLSLPLIGATEMDDWPGGDRQRYKACGPMVDTVLRGNPAAKVRFTSQRVAMSLNRRTGGRHEYGSWWQVLQARETGAQR